MKQWLSEWKGAYHSVHFDVQSSPPYHLPGELGPAHWPQSRYSHIIKLREKAFNYSKSVWADYIWVLCIYKCIGITPLVLIKTPQLIH